VLDSPSRRDLFLAVLEKMRERYRFAVKSTQRERLDYKLVLENMISKFAQDLEWG